MATLFKVRIPANHDPKEEHEVWVSDKASITLYEFEVQAGAFAIGRHPKVISSRVSPNEINVFALVRGQKLVLVDEETQLRFGDNVWYAMQGNHASQIAQIFNDTKLDRRAIDDFYGDWLLSPNVKLGDLPFFTGVIEAESFAASPKSKSNSPSVDRWQQTVAEYVTASLEIKPVSGDTVAINEEWSLVIKEVDDNGSLRTIGLKRKELSAAS